MVAVLASGGGTTVVGWADWVFGRALRRPTPLHGLTAVVTTAVISCQLVGNVTEGSWWNTTVLGRDLSTASAYVGMRLVVDHTEPDAVVVDDVDPMFFQRVSRVTQRRVVSLNKQYIFAPSVHMPRLNETPDLLFELITAGAPVYFVGDPADLASLYVERVVLRTVASAQTRRDGNVVTLYRMAVNQP